MTILNRIPSDWSFEEREKLNDNWTIIESYLSSLQFQINILSGDADVQALIAQIEDIINRGNIVVSDLENALQDATTVINNARNATDDANNAAQDALDAINNIQDMINDFGSKGEYSNSTMYKKNNIIYYSDGCSYIYINGTPSAGNPPPIYPAISNAYWHRLADKGANGDGAVSKVNGKEPNGSGEVTLVPSDIGATSSTDFATLENEFNEHLVESGQFELYHRSGVPLSIPNATGTSLAFTYREISGTGADFSELNENGEIKFKKAGTYSMNVRVAFQQNGTGHRYFGVVYNGSIIFEEARDAAAAVQTYLSLTKIIKVAENDVIGIAVFQDSGGNLEVDGNLAKTFLELNFLGNTYPT